MMKPQTTITLTDELTNEIFTFSRFEIPEKIPFGGAQSLVVHKLVGGKRIIDAMGRDDAPIEWSGRFHGKEALQRARYLDYLRTAGRQLRLSWSEFRYKVVIAEFRADFERSYQIPYRINFTVIEDVTNPVLVAPVNSVGALLNGDLDSANALGDLIGDGVLSDMLDGLTTAIGAVSDFATAAQSTLNSVLQPIADIRGRCSVLLAQVNNVVINVTTVGGVLPNNSVAQQASGLLAQVNACTQSPYITQLDGLMGRMGVNIGAINSSYKTVTVGTTSLYDVAASEYGDANGWTSIAKANNLTDPEISGIQTLTIPPNNDSSGGVLTS